MSEAVIVAIISLVGTLGGAFGGVMTSNRLTGYRIEQLEEKVNKHNNLIERTYKLEERTTVQDKEIEEIKERLDKIA